MESPLVARLPKIGSIGRIRTLGLLIGAIAMTAPTAFAPPAMAQGFFEGFFGSFQRPGPPPSVRSYADPSPDVRVDTQNRRPSAPSGPSNVFCVRLCDGRYFPIQRVRGVNPTELCNSFCPAAQTRVFSGAGIDHAVANDGSRYASLRNAFAYRERTVENCSCNGRDAYGLAPLTTAADPTLRPGDIVATNDGFVAYNGNRRTAEFTPIESYSGLPVEWRHRLTRTRIVPRDATPVSPQVVQDGAAENGRRAQLDR